MTSQNEYRYIRVGKKMDGAGERFYGPRYSESMDEFWKLERLSQMSLISPSFHRERDFKRETDWHRRYFGYVDFDMPGLEGKKAKQAIATELNALGSELLTIEQFGQRHPEFDQVVRETLELANALEKKGGLAPLVYFTGCRGCRVLWLDPKLLFEVRREESYEKRFMEQIAPRYFQELGCAHLVARLDASVYGNEKGIKPDVLAHPTSKLFPVPIPGPFDDDGDHIQRIRLVRRHTADLQLNQAIGQYWKQVAELVRNTQEVERLSIAPSAAAVVSAAVASPPTTAAAAAAATTAAVRLLPAYVLKTIERFVGHGGYTAPAASSWKIKRLQPDDTIWSITLPSGYKYCPLLQTDHSESKTYFVVSQNHKNKYYINLRCHSGECKAKGQLDLVWHVAELWLECVASNVGDQAKWYREPSDAATSTTTVEMEATFLNGTAICPFAHRIHKASRLTMNASWYSKSIQFSCDHPQCRGRAQCMPLTASQRRTLFPATSSAPAPGAAAVSMKYYGLTLPTPDRTLHQRYLIDTAQQGAAEQLVGEQKTLAIRSAMSTGKTKFIEEYLRARLTANPELRVVLITCRRSLAASLWERLKPLEFQCYNQIRSTLQIHACKRLVIQLDSIGHLVPPGRINQIHPAVDMVLLDESESLLKHMMAHTLARRTLVWPLFQHLCRTTEQLMAFDADYSHRTHRFLQSLPRPVHFLHNTFQSDRQQYYFLTNHAVYYHKLRQVLEAGHKVAIPTNCKRVADQLYKYIHKTFPHLRVLLVSSDHSSSKDQVTGQCNTEWIQYDVIIYTPTIGCGVDFHQLYFHCLMPYGITTSTPVREFVQQIGRVRQTVSKQVWIYVESQPKQRKSTQEIITEDTILEELATHWSRLHQLNPALDPLQPQEQHECKDEMGGPCHVKFGDPAYLQLYLVNSLEEQRSRMGGEFVDLMVQALRDHGATVHLHQTCGLEVDQQIETGTQVHQSQEEQEEEAYEALADAHPLTHEEQAKGQRTAPPEHLYWDRKNLIRELGLRQLDPEAPCIDEAQRKLFVDLIRAHSRLEPLRHMSLIMTSDQKLHERCDQQAQAQQDLAYELTLLHDRMRLVKMMLVIMGFVNSSSSAAVAAAAAAADGALNPDRASLCCTLMVNGYDIEQRLDQHGGNPWMLQNKGLLEKAFLVTVPEPERIRGVAYSAAQIKAVTSQILEKTTNIAIESCKQRKHIRIDGKSKHFAQWSLASAYRNSLLELAYVAHLQGSGAGVYSWKTIEQDLFVFPFRWTALTGIEHPHAAAAAAAAAAVIPPPADPLPVTRLKRKRDHQLRKIQNQKKKKPKKQDEEEEEKEFRLRYDQEMQEEVGQRKETKQLLECEEEEEEEEIHI